MYYKLDEKTIGQIAKLYNETNKWTEEGDNENYNYCFQFSSEELFDKFKPDYETCKKIDELIDTWDNGDNSFTSCYFINAVNPTKYETDHNFCEDHKNEIETTLFEQFCHDDGLHMSYYNTYIKFKEFIDRDSLRSELNMDDTEDQRQMFDECFPA